MICQRRNAVFFEGKSNATNAGIASLKRTLECRLRSVPDSRERESINGENADFLSGLHPHLIPITIGPFASIPTRASLFTKRLGEDILQILQDQLFYQGHSFRSLKNSLCWIVFAVIASSRVITGFLFLHSPGVFGTRCRSAEGKLFLWFLFLLFDSVFALSLFVFCHGPHLLELKLTRPLPNMLFQLFQFNLRKNIAVEKSLEIIEIQVTFLSNLGSGSSFFFSHHGLANTI